MKIQARKGRYFAVGPGSVARATRGWELSAWWTRTPFRFENPDVSYRGRTPLVRLWPRQLLVVFSLSEDVDRLLGRSAVMRAVGLCASHNAPVRATGNVTTTILVYLEALAILSVVEHREHYKPMKYRSTAKFSTAAKPKILKTVETEIHRVAVADLA